MTCPDLVRHLLLGALLVGGCSDDGAREGPGSTGLTTSPVTSTSAGSSGDPGGSGSDDDDSSTTDASTSGDPTTDPTTGSTDPTDPTDPTATDSGGGPALCSYSCVGDPDCMVDGADIGLDCLAGECVVGCATADPCIAFHSGWTLNACTANAECDFDVCIPYEGGAGCAITPAVGACSGLGMVEGQRMDTDGNMVTVCTQPTATCIDVDGTMQCHVPCTPTSCGAQTCGADGFCGCDDFVPCYTDGVGDFCTADGECEFVCSGPADCPDTNIDGDQAVCD